MSGYVHVALAFACMAGVVWLSDLHPLQESAALLAGGVIGYFAGTLDAQSIARRVDPANGVDLYDEDVTGFVVAVAIIASAPFAFGSALAVVAKSEALQNGLQGVVCSLAAFWFVHDAVLGRRLKLLEKQTGPLRVRRFYARSVVGPQGLIGQPGVVTRTGGRTYARVRGELWEVESSNGPPFAPGEQIVVTGVKGLRVTVGRQRDGS